MSCAWIASFLYGFRIDLILLTVSSILVLKVSGYFAILFVLIFLESLNIPMVFSEKFKHISSLIFWGIHLFLTTSLIIFLLLNSPFKSIANGEELLRYFKRTVITEGTIYKLEALGSAHQGKGDSSPKIAYNLYINCMLPNGQNKSIFHHERIAVGNIPSIGGKIKLHYEPNNYSNIDVYKNIFEAIFGYGFFLLFPLIGLILIIIGIVRQIYQTNTKNNIT